MSDEFQGVFLRRLTNTICMVPQPLLWIVMEGQSESTEHIEQHKLSGIVHFAVLSNIYDLDFFKQLRQIEVFGTWSMALLSTNKRKVVIQGPVCDSSQVIGWHLRKMNNQIDADTDTDTDAETKPPIHISSFAFNSSILWDPERWGRPTSGQGSSQNSLKFVKQIVLEDETKLKGIPLEECSKIMLWRLQFSIGVVPRDSVKTFILFDVINHRQNQI
ncbi:hypothetical protein V6N12_050119 [Hibiscus sabdariffa]|uniref:Glycosyltransferases n=1 Tax=Hibiscus sabdariffa TaxID=183260 RepID=A0ABR2GBG9_9ROSI